MAHTLSLGDVSPISVRHPAQVDIQRRFPEAHAQLSRRLAQIAEESDRLNDGAPVPYLYFHPTKLAPSISI